MFDWLVDLFSQHPYMGVAAVFIICGIGLPLPEEVVLITAGYMCFKGIARFPPMVATAMVAILSGDLVPFFLGHTFGSRLLRIRPLRFLVTKRRLATFDHWFRRRGELVIFFARFVTGLRMVAYFTAGTMRMRYRRFILLDLIGIAISAPLLVWIGYRFGNFIDEAIASVQRVERGILIAAASGAGVAGLWYWRRRRVRGVGNGPTETFIGPTLPPPPDTVGSEAGGGAEPSGDSEKAAGDTPERAPDA